MPYNPDGSFSLSQNFGTGTPPSNDFPNQVGSVLSDIATSIAVPSLASIGSFLQATVSTTTSVGYLFTSYNAGSFSSGTYTPNAALGNYQYLTNNGAFTWAVPAA